MIDDAYIIFDSGIFFFSKFLQGLYTRSRFLGAIHLKVGGTRGRKFSVLRLVRKTNGPKRFGRINKHNNNNNNVRV